MQSLSAPVIEGWFTTEQQPSLLGQQCVLCGTYVFPPVATACPSPFCHSRELRLIPLSRTGTIWSYTDARYQPPPPYVASSDPYVPFSIAAVELDAERLVVLGQVADGYGLDSLRVGGHVELVVEPLETVDGIERLIWRWRPLTEGALS